jgi:cytochrome c biogenesis protein CcdA
MRRVWPPLFEKYKVDLVFASWHLYERSQQNGVVYVVSGGAGAELIWMAADPAYPSLAEARAHHFCRVDVDGEVLTIRAVASDGTILDEFTLTPKAAANAVRDNAHNLAARVRKPLLFGDPMAAQELKLHLFSYDCAFCRRLTQRVLPDLSQQYGLRLAVDYYDLGLPESYSLFLSAEAAYGRQGADLPAILLGRRILGGENEIRQELSAEIERFLVHPQRYHAEAIEPFSVDAAVDIDHPKENAFLALRLPLVAGAGLLDGLNPCAFTTIILLVSYLHLFGADARRIYWTGTMFTLGVFATYFIIGLTFYHYLQNVLLSPAIATGVNLVLLMAVLLLAFLSLGDGLRVLKTGASGSILKLPRALGDALEARIREHTRSSMGPLAAPFLLGSLVSGIELTCTGQVYIPIVTMIADPQYRLRAVTYLLVYNLAFILPLLVVFLLASWGRLRAGLGKSRTFVATVKFGNAALFSIMAVILLYNIGVI